MLLVSLETDTGVVRRYRRGPAGKAEKVGQDFFKRWGFARQEEVAVFDMLQAYRIDWTPPEDPTPTGAPNMRMARAA